MRAFLPLRFLALFTLTLTLFAAPFGAFAQEASAEGEAASDPQAALTELIEVLRDDQAREALITELEAQVEDSGATEEPAAAEETAESPGTELRSIGGRIGAFSRDVVEGATGSLGRLWTQLAATPQIFAGLNISELDNFFAVLINVAILAAVTYAGLLIMRRLIAAPRNRLQGVFSSGGWVAKPVALVLELVLDILAAAVPYAIGYVVAVGLLGQLGQIRLEHTLYLNAFLMIEVTLSLLRTVLSPNLPDQRLVRLSSAEAKSVMGWARVLIMLFVIGQMLVLPLLAETVSFAAGRAISVVLMLITLAVAAMAVLAARKPVERKLNRMIEDNTARKGFALVFKYWHVFALIYIAILAVVALTNTSDDFQAYLWSNAQIAIVVLVGFIILNIIKRMAGNGVMLPERVRRKSPELQRQLNAIVPIVLKVVRFIVIAVVVIVCLNNLGFFSFVDFLESEFGGRVAGSIITVLLILGMAVIAWIGLNSWIDSQVNPELAPQATARKRTLFALMRNALTIAIIVVTLMFVLSEIGINIAPLIASAGVIGLAIGFGAQKLVQDIITGIFIQLEGAIDVGDVVSIGGISGVVERLTIRSASLRDVEGSYHIIPFSSVDTVTNFMRGFSYALIDMGVAYREDANTVKQAMQDAFDELRADPDHNKNIIGDFEWMGVNAFGASEVVFRARIKTLPGNQWATKRAYNAIVKKVFDERGIEIPFPHQTLYFGVDREGKAPPLHMVRDGKGTDEQPTQDTPAAAGGAKTGGEPPAIEAKPKRRTRKKGEVEGKNMPDVDEGPDAEDR